MIAKRIINKGPRIYFYFIKILKFLRGREAALREKPIRGSHLIQDQRVVCLGLGLCYPITTPVSRQLTTLSQLGNEDFFSAEKVGNKVTGGCN